MLRSILLTKIGLEKKKVRLHSNLHCMKHFNLNHSKIVHHAVPPQVSSQWLSPESYVKVRAKNIIRLQNWTIVQLYLQIDHYCLLKDLIQTFVMSLFSTE